MSDCLVSPDVFNQMVDRLGNFVVSYQSALETEAGQRNVDLYLQGLLSHLPGKNAEDIATLVDVESQVIQDFIGTAPWDHRPLVTVWVGQVADQLGEPDGIITPVIANGGVVLDRGDSPGSAVDTGLDPATSALRAEPAPAGSFRTPGVDDICRQVQRQLMRNESARFYHHRTRKRIPPCKLRL